MSDGYIYFAILRYGGDDTPNLGEGPSTVKGMHHIGFYVDDIEQTSTELEAASCLRVPREQQGQPEVQGARRGDDRRARPRLGRADQGPDAAVSADPGRDVTRVESPAAAPRAPRGARGAARIHGRRHSPIEPRRIRAGTRYRSGSCRRGDKGLGSPHIERRA